jgi:hypothetical protein
LHIGLPGIQAGVKRAGIGREILDAVARAGRLAAARVRIRRQGFEVVDQIELLGRHRVFSIPQFILDCFKLRLHKY